MNKKLIIIGNTGNAKLAHYYFETDSEYEVVAFSVNKKFIKEEEYCNLPVVAFESIESLYPKDQFHLFVAIGYTNMNKIREKIYTSCKQKGIFFLIILALKVLF